MSVYSRRHRIGNLGPIGSYMFEAQAVDRDLIYSEVPAAVYLEVVRNARDEQIDEFERQVRERTRELKGTHEKLAETQARLVEALGRPAD